VSALGRDDHHHHTPVVTTTLSTTLAGTGRSPASGSTRRELNRGAKSKTTPRRAAFNPAGLVSLARHGPSTQPWRALRGLLARVAAKSPPAIGPPAGRQLARRRTAAFRPPAPAGAVALFFWQRP
jgi:hypothetical protein